MLTNLINVIQVSFVFLFVTAILNIIGHSILLLCKIQTRSDVRVTVTLGIGVVSVSLTSAISFRLGFSIPSALMILGIVLSVAVSFRAYSARMKIRAWYTKKSMPGDLEISSQGETRYSWLPVFLTSLVASTLLMLPVSQHGLTSWTSGTADYPSYVSSAIIWLEGEETFEHQQFGGFETAMVHRANFEKPMVTGFLSYLVTSTSLQPHKLLPILMWVPLFLLLMSLLSLNKLISTTQSIEQNLIIVAIAGSTVPMIRLFDAQPGQIFFVGLAVFTILLFFALFEDIKSCRDDSAKVLLVACAIVVTFGSNFSLLLGASPLIAMYIAWLALKNQSWQRYNEVFKRGLLTLVAAGSISTVFVSWYVKSLTVQARGVEGFNIPLLAPHALIGIESNPMRSLPQIVVYTSWLLLVAVLVGFVIRNRKRQNYWPDVLLVSVFFLNATLLVILYGPNSYNFGKFFGVTIAIVCPIFFASIFSRSASSSDRKIAIASSIATFSLISSLSLQVFYLPASLWDDLKGLPSPTGKINVLVGTGIWKASLIATAIDRDIDVKILARAYGSNSEVPYFGSPYIVDSKALSETNHSEPIEIAKDIFLVNITYPYKENIIFTNQYEESKYNLSGSWSFLEEWGIWSTGPKSFVLIDIPQYMEIDSIAISIDATLYQPSGTENSLDVLINDDIKIKDIDPNGPNDSLIEITLNKEEILATEGHLAIELLAKNYFDTRDYETVKDGRSLGVGLKSIRLTLKPS